MTPGVQAVAAAAKALGIKVTIGENGWPAKAMHLPTLPSLCHGDWVREAAPEYSCGTRGCLVGHIGAAFHGEAYIRTQLQENLPSAQRVSNHTMCDGAYDFMCLIAARLGTSLHHIQELRMEPRIHTRNDEIRWMASDVFEDREHEDDAIVEAYCDVAEFAGYEVTPAIRRECLTPD